MLAEAAVGGVYRKQASKSAREINIRKTNHGKNISKENVASIKIKYIQYCAFSQSHFMTEVHALFCARNDPY